MRIKRNLIQICLQGAVAGPNLRHNSAEPVSLLKPTQKAKPMITIHTSTRVRSFLRVTAHVGIFIWLMLKTVSATAQGAGPAIAPSIPEPSPGALTNVLAEIAGLQAEAAARTPAQKKIDSSLLEALREHRGTAPRTYAPRVRSGLRLLPGGRFLVDINANVTDVVLTNLQQSGATIVNSFPQYHSIRAEVSVESMEALAGLADIYTIKPAAVPLHNVGTATSEGDVAHQANVVRSTYGISGSGVKVGVLSDSDRFGAISQANGDLGGVTVLPGQDGLGIGTDEGEGTAMMEIVYDLAPNAQLFYATGDGGEASMASNIISMATIYGCQVIIDDISYADESPFHENQPISQAVKTVSDLGVLYFSSAANEGGQDSGTSGNWQGDFKASAATIPGIPGTLHDWGGGNVFNLVTNKNNGSTGVVLFWSDPWGGASSDYNLYLTDSAGHVIVPGNNVQAGNSSDVPWEGISAATNGQYIVVSRVSGPARMIHVSVMRGGLAISTASATRGHNSASADNAFSVAGVVAAGRTNAFGLPGPGGYFYSYSSDGPRQIFYETDGTAVTPGNFTSSGGRMLQKPDITAATGVIASTNTFGTNKIFTPFYGTSAAAPHAGAIAALLLSYRPDLSPAQVRAALTNETLVFKSLSARDQGAGIVMAGMAIAYLNPTVNFFFPTNGAVLSDSHAQLMSGTASDNTATVGSVRVALSRSSDGDWYDFVSGGWGNTTFDFNRDVLTATGTSSWSAQLPALTNGNYTVRAQSVDVYSHASPWVSVAFTIESPPVVTFSPLTDLQVVFNFDQLGGTVNETSTVQFTIEWFRTGGNLFWNGGNWISVANDPSVLLPASLSGLNWTPAPGTLPPRLQLAQASYVIHVYATNAAGDTGSNALVLTRSAPDTTPPIVNLDSTSIHPGDVITNHVLPLVSGLAYDPESGVAVVNVLLTQITVSGSLYWDGANWNPTPVNLTATYLATNASWHLNVALPGGANLPNATYFLDVSAMNNEVPAGSGSLNLSFSVDYHPVYTFTAGSYNDINPANHNMRWDNLANWDVGSVPTPDARVVITNYSPDNTILGSLQLYRLDLSGGSLTTSGMLITNLNVSGGVLSGGAIGLPANGVFNWSGGILTGIYNVPAGATVNLTGSADKTLSLAKLTNNGAVNWNGGNVLASYGSVIHNHATWVIQSSGFFSDNNGFYGYGYPPPLFVNNGLLQKTNSNGVTTFAPDNGGWTFNQNGTIDVENGALSSQSQFNVDGGAIFAGPGETRVDAGTVVMNGTNTIQQGATVELAGGSWNGNNVFTGPGTFAWSGGTIVGINAIGVGANLSISGAGAKTLTGKLASAGNAAWTGAGAINCSFGSVFENDGTFTVQNDSVFYNNNVFYGYGPPPPVFVNNGSWVKTNSPNTTFFHTDNGGVAFNNHGSVTVRSGNLALGGGGTSQNANFNIASGSEVDLTGGTHNFGSGLNFNGGLTRMMSGILNFSGTNVLTNSAVFEIAGGNVTGTNTVAGTGNFNWSGGTISARLGLQSNIVFNITGAGDKTLSLGTINSSGPGTWTGAGRVNASFGSVFENDGTFTVQNDSVFYNNNVFYGYGYPQPVFLNNGSWVKTNSPNTTFFHTDNGGVAFNNNGSVTVRSGNLALGGGGTSANDSFTTAAGSVIDFTNGAFYFSGNLALLGGGTERVSGASVTFNNGTNTMGGASTFAIASGVISGTNTFAGAGTINWSGGTISARLGLQSNIVFNITGAGDKTLSLGTINSSGPGTWTGAGRVNASFGSVFENDGTFTVQNDSVFYNNNVFYGYGPPPPVFINNGSWVKTNSPNTTFFHTDNGGVAFNNNGSVTVRSGNLALGGGGVGNNGSFAGASGSHIDFLAGNFSLTGNLSFSGAGSTRVNGGALTFGNSASTMVAGGTFEVVNGSAGGTNTFAGTGNFNWSGGTISGTISLQPNIALDITGDGPKTLTGKLASAGNGVWTGAGAINFSYGGLFENDGTFTVQNDSVFYNNNGFYGYGPPPPVFVNTGTFRKTGSTNATVFAAANGGVNFNNNGTVDLRSGTLGIDAGYTTSPANQLDISIGGLNAGTQFGNEDFTGAATFAGTLGISLTNGFTPTNGNSFVIATYSSRTGQFSTIQFPTLPAGSQWQLAYNANALVLQVVQGVPSTAFQSSSLTNGNFQFSFIGATGSVCLIEVSTNLFNWNPLLTNAPFKGLLNYVDPQTPQFPIRFYRATIFP